MDEQLTWLTETPETILLIDTDSVNARRGLTFVEVVLAKGTGVARSAIASVTKRINVTIGSACVYGIELKRVCEDGSTACMNI